MPSRTLTLTFALLLSFTLPTALLAQSDLRLDANPNSRTTAEMHVQIIAVTLDDDAPALVMLEKLLFNYETIPFDYASHQLTPAAEKILNRKARWIKNQNMKLPIVITGHCDQRGSLEYNKYLGALRANSVKQFLINCGITHEQMQITSAGDTLPVNDAQNESAYAKNRRVELTEN